MAIGKPKMTEMSKPAEILYRAFFDELRFAKQQQWTITNYVLLLMGAVFGVVKLTSKSSTCCEKVLWWVPESPTFCEKVVWWIPVALIWGAGLFMLLHLQVYMHKTRARQRGIEQTFSPEDRKLVDPPAEGTDACDPIECFVAVLCAVVTGAAILTGCAIWQL
jgi:hypothetical protein